MSKPLTIPGKTVLFDYGEVISLSPSPQQKTRLETLGGVTDVTREAFWAAYDAHRSQIEVGALTGYDYWRAVGADAGLVFTDGMVDALWLQDLHNWTQFNPATVQLVRDLHAGGTRLAVLSNVPFEYVTFLEHLPFGACFEQVLTSCELGLAKPDPKIYVETLRRLQRTADEIIFIDNRAANITAAEAVGLTGHVFRNAIETRQFLAGFGQRRGL